MMTAEQIVAGLNAPFSAPVIPTGMSRPLTAPEVTACNAKYPVPPWGNTYWDPETGLEPAP